MQRVPSPKQGFTLIETLVVLAVMGILAIITLRNISTVRVATAMNEAVRTVVDAAEDARQASASGREFPDGSGIFPSFGIAFDATKPRDVIVFADCKLDDNDNGQITVADDFTYNSSGTNCAGGPGLLGEVRLTANPRVVIREVRTVSTTTEVQQRASAVYVRPDPTTWLSEGDQTVLPYGRIEVVVGDTGGNYQQTIRFWTSGLIDVAP